ncbi:MAG: type II toxin-antitoxin system VapC family toxin, partial [Methanobrevibacter sp.]|nr:type II toxin-antitoxin system VapC family toxin [Candidatus Methanoflexus mossambicus]
DSDIISYFFRGNKKVVKELINAIENDEKLCISIINIYEILKGLKFKYKNNKINLFEKLLEHLTILYLDDDIIIEASDIYSNLRKKGKTIDDADILIAATVIKNNGLLISNNTKHYKHIDNLNLKNWI